MKACGLVVEYNPFHNGHAFHLEQAKKTSNADIIIAVMSGNFLQRGEPAIVSKWARAKMALAAGVDLVIELPYSFAVQKADRFAYGAVALLDALNADYFCFGSEHGEIEPFIETSRFLLENEQTISQRMKAALRSGVSFPSAASAAIEQVIDQPLPLDTHAPNNILGLSYVKAALELGSSIKPLTIKRTGAHYHDQDVTGHIASATSIRRIIFEEGKSISTLSHVLPNSSITELVEYNKQNKQLHSWEHYFSLLKFRLLTMSHTELASIAEVEEGLEYRFKNAIKEATSFEEFIKRVKTKRYTWTRLQRAAIHILTNTTKEQLITSGQKPAYLRLLGMSEQGQTYLRHHKKHFSLPLVSKISAFSHPQLSLDLKAADTYQLCFDEPLRSQALHKEYATIPIRV
ncbi:nucleotidyltransferase [Bacillus solimangrovi]|uniref:tRNA(Met) cytidine acetate ligase n=1 Tax=Bacillus solimangrovi TaxID=1305675 RepID=A0A1E5LIR0_9BACI|nr:nucleotidyltransferase [Bacillus solimangrovi]OEH93936.1 hypothetical protein BFG57_10740 [Bacillus solimangrovi]